MPLAESISLKYTIVVTLYIHCNPLYIHFIIMDNALRFLINI